MIMNLAIDLFIAVMSVAVYYWNYVLHVKSL